MSSEKKKIDWDSDVVKHYVRRHAWLPAAQDQFEASSLAGRDPSYLTFCAANAVDVFLFLKEGILIRDPETDVVLNTYFCEKEQTEFNEISQLIGAHEQGFLGTFEDMILFEDDDTTRDKDIRDTSKRYRGRQLRQRLNTKERHRQFRTAAPFDVVNLDICGVFFPPRHGEQSPLLRSIATLMDWHTMASDQDESFRSFTVFLSTHMEGGLISQDALEQMIVMVEQNQAQHTEFSEELEGRFGTSDAREIAADCFIDFYCLGLPKRIVGMANSRGWRTEIKFSGRYERTRHSTGQIYSMLAWVGKFERLHTTQLELGDTKSNDEYAKLIKEVIRKPKDVEDVAGQIKDEVECDLASVVSARQEYQARLRSAT